jgi:hypothetical protein
MPVVNLGTKAPFAYEAITVNTATGLTKATWNVSGAKDVSAMLTLETDQIRYTLDGTTVPTNAVGHLMNPTDSLILENSVALNNFKAIKVTNNASLKVTYFKR